MQKILTLLFLLWCSVTTVWSQTATRQISPTDSKEAALQTCQQRLTQIKASYEAGESTQWIGCQSLLLDSMRGCMYEETRKGIQEEMFSIFTQFSEFTLTATDKTAVQTQFNRIQHFIEIAR